MIRSSVHSVVLGSLQDAIPISDPELWTHELEAWHWPVGSPPFPEDTGMGLGSEVGVEREIEVPWSQSGGQVLSPRSMWMGRGFKGTLEAPEVYVTQLGFKILFLGRSLDQPLEFPSKDDCCFSVRLRYSSAGS